MRQAGLPPLQLRSGMVGGSSGGSKDDHNSLIRGAARETLLPLGLSQKGRSRTWIDDHGWWLIVVEFQPSSFGRGSYLNVGHQHLWLERPHHAFRTYSGSSRVLIGRREFVDLDFKLGDASVDAARTLAAAAKTAVTERRMEHKEGVEALHAITRHPKNDPYVQYDVGIAWGLLGDAKRGAKSLDGVLQWEDRYGGWLTEFQRHTSPLLDLIRDYNAFRGEIADRVARSRAALKLSAEVDLDLPELPRRGRLRPLER